MIAEKRISLISKDECGYSDVTAEEANNVRTLIDS
jgi:hypothetical protein